jgi:hypothetical protein
MPAHKLFGLAKEAHSFLSFCEEGLLLIGKHIAARTSLDEDVLDLRGMEAESPRARMHRETAVQTRAFAGEVRDPEIRRLLCALADRYEQMAVPNGGRQRSAIAIGE